METKIEKIDKNKINEEIIEEAGMILKNGGLVAFPTETVYGLGADALKEEAAMKTYAAKGRPSDNPLIVHIAEYEDLRKIAVNIPAETDALAAHFWPGPLTMTFIFCSPPAPQASQGSPSPSRSSARSSCSSFLFPGRTGPVSRRPGRSGERSCTLRSVPGSL